MNTSSICQCYYTPAGRVICETCAEFMARSQERSTFYTDYLALWTSTPEQQQAEERQVSHA